MHQSLADTTLMPHQREAGFLQTLLTFQLHRAFHDGDNLASHWFTGKSSERYHRQRHLGALQSSQQSGLRLKVQSQLIAILPSFFTCPTLSFYMFIGLGSSALAIVSCTLLSSCRDAKYFIGIHNIVWINLSF